MRPRLVPPVLAAGLLVLAACGSSGGSKGAPARSSTTTSTAPVDPAVVAARRIAAAGRIRSEDLPGWKAAFRTPLSRTDTKEVATGLPACASYVAGVRDGLARAGSPQFTRDGTSLNNNVDVFATVPQLRAQLELYRDPAIVGCMQAVFTKVLTASAPAGATVGPVSVSPIAVDPSGDGGYGFRVTATVMQGGASRTILTDRLGVTSGRVGASLNVTGSDTANLAQAESTLLPVMVQRITDAPH